jgi:hypothetical protein
VALVGCRRVAVTFGEIFSGHICVTNCKEVFKA